LLTLAVGVTATLVAWGSLVWSAIDFGSQARAGNSTAWAFLALATLGAVACLLLSLALGQKLMATIRESAPVQPALPPPPGGRRAKR
jgi:hypothetical protein